MNRPTDTQLCKALRVVGSVLGQTVTTYTERRFMFVLAGGWHLSVMPDDAERFRLEVSHGARQRATMWTRAGDRKRLAELVGRARDEVLALEETKVMSDGYSG